MTLRQVDIARALNCSEMTVSRLLKALHRANRPLTQEDVIALFCVAGLQELRFSGRISVQVLNELSSELRYLLHNPENRCWVVFIEKERTRFRMPCLSISHLATVIDANPLSLVLPLHELTARAGERMAALKSEKEAA